MTGRLSRQVLPHDAEGRLFRYPLDPCPKVTVICDTLQVPAGCTHVAESNPIDARTLRAETLAAPASILLSLGDGWKPQFPLVAFTGARHGFLDDDDRALLWRRFQVPVFEQLVDDEGRVVASECEAHAGLHVHTSARHMLTDIEILLNGLPSGIAAREAAGLCGCGRIGPRLLELGSSVQLLNAMLR